MVRWATSGERRFVGSEPLVIEFVDEARHITRRVDARLTGAAPRWGVAPANPICKPDLGLSQTALTQPVVWLRNRFRPAH